MLPDRHPSSPAENHRQVLQTARHPKNDIFTTDHLSLWAYFTLPLQYPIKLRPLPPPFPSSRFMSLAPTPAVTNIHGGYPCLWRFGSYQCAGILAHHVHSFAPSPQQHAHRKFATLIRAQLWLTPDQPVPRD